MIPSTKNGKLGEEQICWCGDWGFCFGCVEIEMSNRYPCGDAQMSLELIEE